MALIPLVLASTSPRRRDLLAGLGWPFEVFPPQVDERPGRGETPDCLVERLAREKALSTVHYRPECWHLGSDTLVALGDRVLGKPCDDEQAYAMLHSLSGRTHQVYSGIALAQGNRCFSAVDRADVTFRPLTDEEIWAYIATGEGRDKAGSYALQGRGALLVERVDGHPATVVGLPLGTLSALMERVGVSLVAQWRLES